MRILLTLWVVLSPFIAVTPTCIAILKNKPKAIRYAMYGLSVALLVLLKFTPSKLFAENAEQYEALCNIIEPIMAIVILSGLIGFGLVATRKLKSH